MSNPGKFGGGGGSAAKDASFSSKGGHGQRGAVRIIYPTPQGQSDTTTIIDRGLPPVPFTISYLVIGGGGSGGGDPSTGASAAGGGAGGYRSSYSGDTYSGGSSSLESPLRVNAGSLYTVTVGAGGAGVVGQGYNNGNSSVFSTITSLGGGGGNNVGTVDGDVGSGGGRQNSSAGVPGGAGTTGQGTAGGDGLRPGSDFMGGGGGGAGTAGTNATSGSAGSGGSGLASSITGSSVTRGGGGAASSYLNNHGSAGSGGGGSAVGGSGTANTGGGGGAGRRGASSGAGGSGIVILRYPDTITISVGAGLTSSTTTVGSDKVTTFTAGTDTVSFS